MSAIQTHITNGVMCVKIHRPERKNSLTSEMYAALAHAVGGAEKDGEVKALVITGSEGVFTAGNDLDDFVQNPPKDIQAPVFQFMTAIAAFSKPLIAAVEGLAIGVGTTMLFHCDLVYIADNAKFAMPFVGLGLVPEAGSSLLFPQLAGHQLASEKLLLGDMFTAVQAEQLGFVNRVLPAAEVLPFAIQQAERLALLPAGSVQGTKALIKRRYAAQKTNSHEDTMQAQIQAEVELFVRRVTGPATIEAITAFKEKRKPNFIGKD
jgi:enoyl-CoA hydratase/carnithine racemase